MKNLILFFIRVYYRVLSVMWPTKAGTQAFNLFQRTRKLPLKLAERDFYDQARKFEVVHPLENIQAYELGDSQGDLVVLVHGWESNAGSMGAIARRLADNGFRVIALDLPAHGFSRLTHTNLRECREALRALIYQIRPASPFSVVSHSFGSAVAAMALSGTRYEVDQWIMLTSPNRLMDIFSEFKAQIALGDLAFQELLNRASKILAEPVQDVAVEIKARQVRYKNLVIIHDVQDQVLPLANSIRLSLALPRTELYKIKKAGHYRMLWNEGVLFKIVRTLVPVKKTVAMEYPELMSA